MSSSLDFIEYVCAQIKGTGVVHYRKMFGEYMIYVNAKPILLVCDNTVYIKMRDEIKEEMADAEIGNPYDGAKPHYILDIDDRELAGKVISMLEPITPLPKSKKRRKKVDEKNRNF
jgi:TfoX/Sxy family transcriptional regulator of competence genes